MPNNPFPDDDNDQFVYIPYSDTTQASVWAVDAGLQMFTNISEAQAAILAGQNLGHIYFFAELTTEDPKEAFVRWLNESLENDLNE